MAVASIARLLMGLGRQGAARVAPVAEETILANVYKAAPEMAQRASAANTGFTFNPRTGTFLEPGRDLGSMMGTQRNLPDQLGGAGTATTPEDIVSVLSQPRNLRRLQRGEYVGAWNPTGEGIGLDTSRRYGTQLGAMLGGRRTGQLEGFNLGRAEGYDLSNKADWAKAAKRAGAGAAAAGAAGALGVDYAQDRDLDIMEALGGTEGLAAAAAIPLGAKVPGLGKALSGAAKGRNAALASRLSTVTASGAGDMAPSAFANSIVNQAKSQVKTIVTKKKVKGEEVERKREELIFSPTEAQYPKELSDIGMVPVPNYNYLSKGTQILKLDEPTTLDALKNNIRALVGFKGDPNFYTDASQALVASTGRTIPADILGGTFAPFSAGSSVPKNATLARRFIENPELFPGRFPGEGSLTAGSAWNQALRSFVNENPLDPFNFSNTGKVIKIGSFADNLGRPTESLRATIDRHAVQAALGMRPIKDETIPDLGDEQVYRLFERAYQEVADEIGVLPSQLQSEVWDIWRKLMLKNPGAAAPSTFIVPANPSQLWKMSNKDRKKFLRDALGTGADAKSEKWLADAMLLD